jgi:acetoin utilization deacetylase AcuC-like enzyme
VAEGVLDRRLVREPEPAGWEELGLVHDADYLRRVREGGLTALEQRRIGFPWTPEMVERSRRSVGATIQGARAALGMGRTVGWGSPPTWRGERTTRTPGTARASASSTTRLSPCESCSARGR